MPELRVETLQIVNMVAMRSACHAEMLEAPKEDPKFCARSGASLECLVRIGVGSLEELLVYKIGRCRYGWIENLEGALEALDGVQGLRLHSRYVSLQSLGVDG